MERLIIKSVQIPCISNEYRCQVGNTESCFELCEMFILGDVNGEELPEITEIISDLRFEYILNGKVNCFYIDCTFKLDKITDGRYYYSCSIYPPDEIKGVYLLNGLDLCFTSKQPVKINCIIEQSCIRNPDDFLCSLLCNIL